MQTNNIIKKLKAHGVTEEDMITFTLKLRDKSFTLKDCDAVLTKLGYAKLFSTKKEEQPINNENCDNELINDFLNKRTSANNDISSHDELFQNGTFEMM